VISGLSHLTFIVQDLEKMTKVIVEVLGGREIYASGARQYSLAPEKFFMVGDVWVAIMEGESLPTTTYNHAAFRTDEAGLERAKRAIKSLGLDLRQPRPRIEGEALSLYFYDFDNHLFELHTGNLDERLAAYRKMDQLP
jgi:catechol 2,3-dioxygenase-like lactoylglutathione lyase family enzyme